MNIWPLPPWLPPRVMMSDYDGNFARYIDAVHAIFRNDFEDRSRQPQLDGLWVRHRRDPVDRGKSAGFWHCVSEDVGNKREADRRIDTSRCECIGWVRAVIVNASDPRVDRWENDRNGNRNTLLWFDEDYLVVLSHRTRDDGFRYFQLLTAYPTPQEHRKAKLRSERDSSKM